MAERLPKYFFAFDSVRARLKGMGEEGAGVPSNEIIVDQVEPVFADMGGVFLFEEFVADMEPGIVGGLDDGYLFHLWQLGLYGVAQGQGYGGPSPLSAGDIGGNAVDPVRVGAIRVVVHLVLDPKEDEDGGGHARGEAGDIYPVDRPVLPAVAPGSAKVVSDHLSLV